MHNGVFHLRQLNALAVLLQRTVAGIQQERCLPDLAGILLFPAAAAHQRVHAGSQLCRGKRLGHIVIRAGHQSRHLVHLLRAGRKHNDTDTGVGCTDAAAHLKPVDTGQHNVQQRHAHIRILLQLLQRFLAGFRLYYLIAGALQIDHNKSADTGFILQNQNFFHQVSPLFLYDVQDDTIRLKFSCSASSPKFHSSLPSSSSPA